LHRSARSQKANSSRRAHRKEAFAAGEFAAQSALTGSGSVVLHYDGDRIESLILPLNRVAGKTRYMPDDFFAGSNTISDEGRRYFRRLLGDVTGLVSVTLAARGFCRAPGARNRRRA
jgi:hypothetical protein